jgi:hypothetical protein
MRYRLEVRLTRADVGKRVVIRWRLRPAVWVPIIVSLSLTWSFLVHEGRQIRYLAAQARQARALSVLVTLRVAYLRCSAPPAGLLCSAAPTGPMMPRSFSCAARSWCSSARPGHRNCPGADRVALVALARLLLDGHPRQLRLIVPPRTLLR